VARLAVIAFALGTTIATAMSATVGAQELSALHVRGFTMSLDRTTIRVGESVHLTIAAQVDEGVLELDNVTLPDLSGFDTLGDERRCSATSHGSNCIEIITLAPTVAGDRTIAATVMDAVDGRNGKPSRFATNTVALHVLDAPSQLPRWIAPLGWSLLLGIMPLVLVAVAAWALIWGFRRKVPVPAVPASIPAAPPPVIDPDVRLRARIADLAREPTRAHALAVRSALRERVGARDDETLADIAARANIADRTRLLAALRAIERVAFCEDERIAHATDEALPWLNF